MMQFDPQSGQTEHRQSSIPLAHSHPLLSAFKYSFFVAILEVVLFLSLLTTKMQVLFQRVLGFYVPLLAVVIFLVGGLICNVLLNWMRWKKPGIVDTTPAYVLRKGTRERRLVQVAFSVCALLTLAVPYWQCYRYHHPGCDEQAFLIYIDSFEVTGWNRDDLVMYVKRDLQRELKELLPEADVEVLRAPQGIDDRDKRLDWACEKGAKIVIYATGSPDRISPHIRLCSESVPSLPVFSDPEDTVDFGADVRTASFVATSMPDYARLEPPEARRLCVIKELTPKTVNYLTALALGLCCLYDSTLELSTLERYRRAHALLDKAVSLGSDTLACNLNYCEALYYFGTSKMFLASCTSDTAEVRRLMCAADNILVGLTDVRSEPIIALLNRGGLLTWLGRFEEGIAVYKDVLDCTGNSDKQADKVAAAIASINIALNLRDLGQREAAIAACDSVVSRLGRHDIPAAGERIAEALFYKGVTLGDLGQHHDAIVVYTEIVRRFGQEGDVTLNEWVAKALFARGNGRERLRYSDDAVSDWDEVIRRLGRDTGSVAGELVASALLNKGMTLGRSGRKEAAIESYDDVISRFGKTDNLRTRVRVAKALVNKSGILLVLAQDDEAIAVCDDLLNRLGREKERSIQIEIAKALLNKAIALERQSRNAEALNALDEMLGRLDGYDIRSVKELVLKAHSRMGRMLRQMGRLDEAKAILCAAWKLRESFDADEVQQLRWNFGAAGLSPEDCP